MLKHFKCLRTQPFREMLGQILCAQEPHVSTFAPLADPNSPHIV